MNVSRTRIPVRRKGLVPRRAHPRLEHLEDRTLLDVGDTLATALNTQLGPPPGTYNSPAERLGDGDFGSRDVDLYRFEANAGARITAQTERPPGGQEVDTILRLFNDAGQQLTFNDDCPGAGVYSCISDFNLPGAGLYYVGVSGFPNFNYNPRVGGSGPAGKTGDFRLTLTLVGQGGGPDIGDTLAKAEVTKLGPGAGTYTLPTQPIGNGPFGDLDVDLFVFEAEEGLVLTATTERPAGGAGMDTVLRLFDAKGQEVALNDDCETGRYSCIYDFSIPATGTYYAGVSGYANSTYDPTVGGSGIAGSTGDFSITLTLEDVGPDIGDTLAKAEVTELGPGAGTYTLPTQPIGNGPFGDLDVDLFAFEANEGLLLTATTERPAGGAGMDTILRLFDAKGQEVAINDDCGGSRYSCINDFSIPATGTYYAGVSGYDNRKYDPTVGGSGIAGSIGDFSVTLTLTDPGGAPSPGGSDGAATIGILQLAPASVPGVPVHEAAGAPSGTKADLSGPDSATVDRLFTVGSEEQGARPWDRRLARTGGLDRSSIVLTGDLLDSGLTEVVLDLHRAGNGW